jgi:hypothetical protein
MTPLTLGSRPAISYFSLLPFYVYLLCGESFAQVRRGRRILARTNELMAQAQSDPVSNRPATSVVLPFHCASFAPFDPAQGFIVRQPPGEGAGYWVGAPGAMFDSVDGRFYLVYRLRRPRGVNPDRGGEVRIAASADGIFFEDIWSGTKDQLESPSIERCALARDAAGSWMLSIRPMAFGAST